MSRRPIFAVTGAVMFILLFSGSALAVYSWVDDKGQLHITDYPKPENPAEHASVEAEKERGRPAPALSESALKADRPQSVGESVRQPSSTAASVPGQPKHEQPGVPSAPNQQHLNTVSSPTATPVAFMPQPAAAVSSIAPQEIPVDKNAPGETMQNSGVAELIKTFVQMFFFFLILGYFYFSLCLYLIARKLNVSSAWIAWVPLFQILTFLESASKPAWWVLLFFVPFVNMFISIYLWMCISENLGKGKWLGLLMLVPVANLIFLGMLAFSSQGSRSDVNVAVS